jgi:molecular chaperone DnaK
LGKMIGIDLGTTNSCVAVMEGGVPQVIPNQEGARTTPSIVGFTAKGERLVGGIAKRLALTRPKNTVLAVKRLMGRKSDDPESEQARQFLPFELVPAENGDLHIKIEDKVYSPPEISSFVLQKLKAAAEDYLGEAVEEAIITVPAYFNDPQRQATRDAGLIAGLKVCRIINEPTAAALAYGFKSTRGDGQMVAVLDLGGGTFDITILEMAEGLLQVRATGGDTYLGGEDFDQRIVDWLIEEFQNETQIDLKQDRMALQRLKEAAEKAKCELSTAQQTEIVLPFISADASGPKHLNTVLTREQYETLSNDLLERTIEPCEKCLADAGLKPDQIDEVLLVGGQTRAPRFTELARSVFGREPNRGIDPDEGVAMGAAIQTGLIQGEVKDIVLLDVTPHTLYIEPLDLDHLLMPLIEGNSTIPTRKSRVFTTVSDNQTRLGIHLLQGESGMERSTSLATIELTSIPPAPRGVPQVEVSFEIDVNGIVSVSAQDRVTGRHQSMTTHPSGGLSQSEVSRLVEEARIRELEEKESRNREAVPRQLDGLVANTMRTVQALEGKLEGGEQEEILESIEKAKKALDSAKKGEGDAEELKARLGDMEKAATIIGKAMLRSPDHAHRDRGRSRIRQDLPGHQDPGGGGGRPVPAHSPGRLLRDGPPSPTAEGGQAGLRTSVALLCAPESLEAELRQSVLYRRGMKRLWARSATEASDRASAERLDIVVVDSALPGAARLVAGLRETPGTSNLPIAALARDDLAELKLIQAGAHTILRLPSGPEWDDRLVSLMKVPVRRQARVPVDLRLTAGVPIPALVLDLSAAGMRVLCLRSLRQGDQLQFSFSLPGRTDLIRGEGTVVRVEGRHQYGVELVRLEGEGQRLIREFFEPGPTTT